jgi:uridine phosphorylase
MPRLRPAWNPMVLGVGDRHTHRRFGNALCLSMENERLDAIAGWLEKRRMNWFDPSDDVVIQPSVDRARFWKRKYGIDRIAVASQVLYANNGHGKLFDAVCQALDQSAVAVHDHRQQGYCHYRSLPSAFVTVYRAPEPAPYAAADLEFLISAGARQIVFINGAGSLRPDVPIGTILLPGELIREEGTSFHYAPPEVVLHTNEQLNDHIRSIAEVLGVELMCGKHWTTDAIYRTTFGKVKRYRGQGANSVDMELSALAGVAHCRQCELSALLVVTDVASRSHTWNGTASIQFHEGVRQAAQVAARIFPFSQECAPQELPGG